MSDTRIVEIFRYDPDRDPKPYVQTYEFEVTRTVLRPLPGLLVVRDLIVDMTAFFNQHHSIKPVGD